MIPDMVALVAARNVPFFEEYQFTDGGAPLNLTGCTARLQVRQYGAAPGSALIDLTNVTADETEGVWISDAVNGVVKPWIAAATLTALPAPEAPNETGDPATFVYDLVITWPDGLKETFMEGMITVKPGVTR